MLLGLSFSATTTSKPLWREKVKNGFRDKIKTLTGNNIRLLCQGVLCFIPAFTSIRLARKVSLKFREFAFSRSVKVRVRDLFAIRSRQKIVCPDIHTTSGLGNTFQCVRHFANDKAIPATCRFFQRDLFRVSTKRTVLTDLHFTEFGNFQTVIPSACFTNGILADTFTRLECVFAQTPRQRADRGFVARVTFLLCTLAASATEMFMRSVDAFDGRYLQVLWMIGIVRSGSTEVLQMINLVIHRHRLASIVPHLIPHLEHVVLQLLLVAQLRKKPTILCFRRIRTIFESVFHGFSRITPLTPYQWVGPTHCRETTLIMSVQRDITIKPQFINFVKCFFEKTLWPYTRG